MCAHTPKWSVAFRFFFTQTKAAVLYVKPHASITRSASATCGNVAHMNSTHPCPPPQAGEWVARRYLLSSSCDSAVPHSPDFSAQFHAGGSSTVDRRRSRNISCQAISFSILLHLFKCFPLFLNRRHHVIQVIPDIPVSTVAPITCCPARPVRVCHQDCFHFSGRSP